MSRRGLGMLKMNIVGFFSKFRLEAEMALTSESSRCIPGHLI